MPEVRSEEACVSVAERQHKKGLGSNGQRITVTIKKSNIQCVPMDSPPTITNFPRDSERWQSTKFAPVGSYNSPGKSSHFTQGVT